jgi:hypothetical protein
MVSRMGGGVERIRKAVSLWEHKGDRLYSCGKMVSTTTPTHEAQVGVCNTTH